jgi:predicted phosphate transport protein (TIGR00153 family)
MVLSKFMPSNPKFAAKFAEAARNAHVTAQALVDLLENYSDVETKVQRVRDLEHEGDRLSREVTNMLAASFIVPFDREDIISLRDELDDLVDDMEDAARKLSLYGVERPLPQMAQLARVVEQQCALLAQGMPMIEDAGRARDLAQIAVQIRTLEDEGDTISDEVQRTLYHGVTDVPGMIRAMRGGEIANLLEDASDQAQRVAKTVESILLKNA